MARPRSSIVISRHYLPPQIGGISSMMEGLARGLAPNVTCLTGVLEGDDGELDRSCRVIRRAQAFSPSAVVQGVTLAWTLAEISARQRLAFAHLATVGEGYIGLHLKRWLGIPFLIYAHGNEIAGLSSLDFSGWRAPIEALHASHRIVAVSQETASRVKAFGVLPEKVRVVHPGCDVDLFRPVGVDSALRRRILGEKWNHTVIVTVGNLVERKGHDMVLRALPLIRAKFPDIVYLIVGIGARREYLERLAAELGVRDHIVFLGAPARGELPAIYAMSDVFVMTSRTREEAADLEGFGLVYLEAAACRKPVVAGRAGGAPEAVVDGETGLLVDPLSPEEIAKGLLAIVTNPEVSARMGAAGYRRVHRSFLWSRFSRDIEALMEEPVIDVRPVVAGGT